MRKTVILIVVFIIVFGQPIFLMAEDDTRSDVNEGIDTQSLYKNLAPKKFSTALFWDMVPILTIGAWGAVCFTLESDPRNDDPRADCFEVIPLLGPLLLSVSYIPIDAYAKIPKPGIIAYSTLKILIGLTYLPFAVLAGLSGLSEKGLSYEEEYDKRWNKIRGTALIWGSAMMLIQGIEVATQYVYIKKYNNKLNIGISFMPKVRDGNNMYLMLNYTF